MWYYERESWKGDKVETVTKKMILAKKWVNDKKSTISLQSA